MANENGTEESTNANNLEVENGQNGTNNGASVAIVPAGQNDTNETANDTNNEAKLQLMQILLL